MIHAKNFAAGIGSARLTAVVDPVAASLKSALNELGLNKGYSDYRKALECDDIGAVVIATPTAYHRDIAVAAAQAHRPIRHSDSDTSYPTVFPMSLRGG